MTEAGRNLKHHNAPSIVDSYTKRDGLFISETYVFEKYFLHGSAVLDLGVGTGRTTPYLSSRASRYVGVDFSEGMVDVFRRKFPFLEIYCDDASDLKRFEDESFDVVVFSFNGIDNFETDEDRRRCFLQVKRVLRPGGRFIFSSHNARYMLFRPVLRGANPIQIIWRCCHALYASSLLAGGLLLSGALHNGAGYVASPVEGGLRLFYSTPERITSEGQSAGFRVIEIVNGRGPLNISRWFTAWYYYVLEKR
jgi:SAM-dependent methyltransferase